MTFRWNGLSRGVRLRKIGKNAFLPAERPLPPGRCTWCGIWTLKLDRDHVLPRDLFPGALRDHDLNLVPACRSCNRKRADGKLKPWWHTLPHRTQRFVLSHWTPARLARHFQGVPQE